MVAIVVGVLVVIGGGIAAAVLLLGGDGSDMSTDSPRDTVDSYTKAIRDGDCDAIASLFTERFAKDIAAQCTPEDLKEAGEVDFSGAEITQKSENSAVAKVVDGNTTYELHLVNENGAWLIDQIGGSVSSEGGADPGS